MIRVTVELVSARTGKTRILGIGEIANDGTGTVEVGHYNVALSKWAPKQNEIWKKGCVEGFDREKRGPWDLLYLALHSCVGSRNKRTAAHVERGKHE